MYRTIRILINILSKIYIFDNYPNINSIKNNVININLYYYNINLFLFNKKCSVHFLIGKQFEIILEKIAQSTILSSN